MHWPLTRNPDGCSVPNCKLDPLYESGPILYHERKWSRADADTKHMTHVLSFKSGIRQFEEQPNTHKLMGGSRTLRGGERTVGTVAPRRTSPRPPPRRGYLYVARPHFDGGRSFARPRLSRAAQGGVPEARTAARAAPGRCDLYRTGVPRSQKPAPPLGLQ